MRDPTGAATEAQIAACRKATGLSVLACIDKIDLKLGVPSKNTVSRRKVCGYAGCSLELSQQELDQQWIDGLMAFKDRLACTLNPVGCAAAVAATKTAKTLGVDDPTKLEIISIVAGTAGGIAGLTAFSPPESGGNRQPTPARQRQSLSDGGEYLGAPEVYRPIVARQGVEGIRSPGLTKEARSSVKNYQRRIAEHKAKLEKFERNPTVRPGMDNQPIEQIREQQQIRIEHLRTEMGTFEENIAKILRGELDS